MSDLFGNLLVMLGVIVSLPSTIIITALMPPAAIIMSLLEGDTSFVTGFFTDLIDDIRYIFEVLVTPSLW